MGDIWPDGYEVPTIKYKYGFILMVALYLNMAAPVKTWSDLGDFPCATSNCKVAKVLTLLSTALD